MVTRSLVDYVKRSSYYKTYLGSRIGSPILAIILNPTIAFTSLCYIPQIPLETLNNVCVCASIYNDQPSIYLMYSLQIV